MLFDKKYVVSNMGSFNNMDHIELDVNSYIGIIKKDMVYKLIDDLYSNDFNSLFSFKCYDIITGDVINLSAYSINEYCMHHDSYNLRIECTFNDTIGCGIKESIDIIPKELLCKYIIPLKGNNLCYRNIDYSNTYRNCYNVLFVNSSGTHDRVITNTHDRMIVGDGIVPDLSSFWKRLKFGIVLLFSYGK